MQVSRWFYKAFAALPRTVMLAAWFRVAREPDFHQSVAIED